MCLVALSGRRLCVFPKQHKICLSVIQQTNLDLRTSTASPFKLHLRLCSSVFCSPLSLTKTHVQSSFSFISKAFYCNAIKKKNRDLRVYVEPLGENADMRRTAESPQSGVIVTFQSLTSGWIAAPPPPSLPPSALCKFINLHQQGKESKKRKKVLSINFSCHGIYSRTGALCCENIITKSPKSPNKTRNVHCLSLSGFEFDNREQDSVIYHKRVGCCDFIAAVFLKSHLYLSVSSRALRWHCRWLKRKKKKRPAADDALCCNTSQTSPFCCCWEKKRTELTLPPSWLLTQHPNLCVCV